MWFKRMPFEEWFDQYQYEIDFDIGESAVKTLKLEDIPIDLKDVSLRYGFHRGKPELRALIAEQYPGLSPENIIVTSGASEANFDILSALVNPGEHVIIEHPNYPSLYEVPRSLGCRVDLFRLNFDRAFKPDWERLERMFDSDTRLVSLTHPNNPTGSMITEEDLHRAVRIAEAKGVYLLFDETYRSMAFDHPLPAAASLSSKVISISSMSKCYGIPGIRIGWLASRDPEVIERVLSTREQVSIANNALGEEIAIQVLRNKADYLESARRRITANRAVVDAWMREQRDFEWIPPEAGVVGFPRLKPEVKVEPEELYRLLAEKYRTFVVPGRCFEMDERHFRVGFGAEAEEIRRGLGNLAAALKELT